MNRRQIIRTSILVASLIAILVFVAVVAASCGRTSAEREESTTASGLTTPTPTPGRLSLGATGTETATLSTPPLASSINMTATIAAYLTATAPTSTDVPTADPTATPTATPAPTDVPTQAPTVVPPTAVVIVVTATPTTPALVVTPPAPSGTGCMTAGDMAVLVAAADGDPYELIPILDARPEKQDHPVKGWTLTGPGTVWTGSYVPDVTYGGRVVPLLVDGKTGVWAQLPSTEVTWLTPGGSIAICDATTVTASPPASTTATPAPSTSATAVPPTTAPTVAGPTCVDTAIVIDLINANKANADQVFVKLDEIADAVPTARLRMEGPASYTVENLKAVFWVQTGKIVGNTVELHRNDSKSLYLGSSDGEVSLTYPHSGLRLCQDLNPVRDFPWWK